MTAPDSLDKTRRAQTWSDHSARIRQHTDRGLVPLIIQYIWSQVCDECVKRAARTRDDRAWLIVTHAVGWDLLLCARFEMRSCGFVVQRMKAAAQLTKWHTFGQLRNKLGQASFHASSSFTWSKDSVWRRYVRIRRLGKIYLLHSYSRAKCEGHLSYAAATVSILKSRSARGSCSQKRHAPHTVKRRR